MWFVIGLIKFEYEGHSSLATLRMDGSTNLQRDGVVLVLHNVIYATVRLLT